MMTSKPSGNNSNTQSAVATHTASGSESSYTLVAATLPGGAVGFPKSISCSGNVGGLVQFQFGSQAVKTVAVAPNQLPVVIPISPSAFPNKVGSVNVQFEAFGAGTLVGIVDFAVG